MNGHMCTPGRVEWKFDGGRGALLCGKCRTLVGYLPQVPCPRPEQAVKAEALREAASLVDAECPHEPDEHAEGSCNLCDFTFAVTAQIHERADRIEAGEE